MLNCQTSLSQQWNALEMFKKVSTKKFFVLKNYSTILHNFCTNWRIKWQTTTQRLIDKWFKYLIIKSIYLTLSLLIVVLEDKLINKDKQRYRYRHCINIWYCYFFLLMFVSEWSQHVLIHSKVISQNVRYSHTSIW